MKKETRYLLLCCMAFLLAGCTKQETERPAASADRVLLVYFAADNNFSGNVQANIDDIVQGIDSAPENTSTIIYCYMPGENPRLQEATAAGVITLHTWPTAQHSASVAVMREVIDRVRRVCPANRYGLVLWSHGMAWVPSTAADYFTRSFLRSSQSWPDTKYFGQDTNAVAAGYLETADLLAAIPDRVFDYILFDACFMGSAELLYALRNKTDYIVSSPTEVIADGFPYARITSELLKEAPDLRAVCQTFYTYYAEHPQPNYRSASVSLVKTSRLDALAEETARLYSSALAKDPDVFTAFDISAIQPFDRYRRHFLFDMGSIADELESTGKVSEAEVADWKEQLSHAIIYKAHTSAFFDLPIDFCCGLFSYVPVGAYNDLNEYYATLEWYKRLKSIYEP